MAGEKAFSSENDLVTTAVEQISTFLRATLQGHGRAGLAVCGGRSPVAIFKALSLVELDWAKVTVTLTDDRVVAPDDPDSNQRLVRETLLQNKAAAAAFVPILCSADPLELNPALADFPWQQCFGLFGMGEDGHIASLFPTDQRRPLSDSHLAVTGPKPPFERVSLAPDLIQSLPQSILLILGAEKAARLTTIRSCEAPDAYPANLLLTSSQPVDVLIRP